MFAAVLLAILCSTAIVSGYKSSNGTNICCDGTVADISMDCCGSKVFDPKKMFCCNEQLMPKPKDQETDEFKCCTGKQSTEIYNTRTSVCCGGVISKTPPEINAKNEYSCCDDPVTNLSKPFNSSKLVCCQGVILEKKVGSSNPVCCGKELMTNVQIGSIWDAVFIEAQDHQECAVVYNRRTGEKTYKLLNLTMNTAVCALEVYNKTTHWCCNFKIIPKSKTNWPCCYADSSAYDPRSQFCGETGVNDLDQTVVNTYKKYIDLCGPSFPPSLPRSPPTQLETFVYSSFNSTHICCNGVIGKNTERCCGTGVYDPRNSYCCGGISSKMPPGYKSWKYGCCQSSDGKTSKTYEIDTSLCCQGEVYSSDSGRLGCCLNSDVNKTAIYNYTSSICCNGNLFARKDPTKLYTCCGSQPVAISYNVNGGINQYVSDELCCGEESKYNPATQLCASSLDRETYRLKYKILDKQNNRSGSCGFRLYDTQTEGCCNENVYTLTTSPQCCYPEPMQRMTRLIL